MKIKDLEKATTIIARIKEFDKKIIELERLASKGEELSNMQVNLSYKPPVKSSDICQQEQHQMHVYSFLSMMYGEKSKPEDTSVKFPLDDFCMLTVIEAVYRCYQFKRQELIKSLEELGVRV